MTPNRLQIGDECIKEAEAVVSHSVKQIVESEEVNNEDAE